MKRKKNKERMATPFPVRVCQRRWLVNGFLQEDMNDTYDNSVVPGKDCKLIKSSDEIPPSCDVAGYEYAECQDGKRGHEAALLLDHGILS
jgi:hypothetical protein